MDIEGYFILAELELKIKHGITFGSLPLKINHWWETEISECLTFSDCCAKIFYKKAKCWQVDLDGRCCCW